MYKYTVIKKASPNRHGIRIIQGEGETGYHVEELIEFEDESYWEHADEGNGLPFDTLEEATKAFDERVKELSNTPNWAAQEEYDREYGTINGYAPWQYDNEY